MLPTHLNQAELARRWKVSERSLERYRSEGVGPIFTKIVGRIIYSLDDIKSYEEASRHVPHNGGEKHHG